MFLHVHNLEFSGEMDDGVVEFIELVHKVLARQDHFLLLDRLVHCSVV